MMTAEETLRAIGREIAESWLEAGEAKPGYDFSADGDWDLIGETCRALGIDRDDEAAWLPAVREGYEAALEATAMTDVLYALGREIDARTLRLFAADCAARVLSVFESHCPDDTRPRQAIIAIREMARGEWCEERGAAARAAAIDAVRAAPQEAAKTAAWAAAWAVAGTAPREDAWTAAKTAARIAAARAAESVAWDAVELAAEHRWQHRRLSQIIDGHSVRDVQLPGRAS